MKTISEQVATTGTSRKKGKRDVGMEIWKGSTNVIKII
jgi:hypothetical protein